MSFQDKSLDEQIAFWTNRYVRAQDFERRLKRVRERCEDLGILEEVEKAVRELRDA